VGDLVVVQLAVLGAGAVHPHRTLAFDEDTSAVVDVDLVVISKVEFVVSDPEPVVLEVDGGLGSDVEEQEGAVAFGEVGGWGAGILGARIRLKPSSCGAADAEMHVPHTRGSWRGGPNVPFDHDGAWLGIFGRED